MAEVQERFTAREVTEAKNFLRMGRRLQQSIQKDEDKLEQLRSLCTKVTPTLSPTGGGISSGNSDRISDSISEIVDLEEELRWKRITQVTELSKLRAVIGLVEQPLRKQILTLHYYRFMSFDAVALRLEIPLRRVLYLHRLALFDVCHIIKKNPTSWFFN